MKRFLFFVIAVLLAVLAVEKWNQNGRLGAKHRPEKYTPRENPTIDLKDVQVLAAMDKEYTTVVEKVVPSVVSILTSRKVRAPVLVDPYEELFGMRRRRGMPRESVQNALGSGVIVSKEGHVLTNNHVVANMDEVKVQLNDGTIHDAQVIGSDQETDIAVLKIEAKDVVPLAFANSDEVKVGQLVFAVGNPFGLQETVTQGIISAKGRRAMDDSAVEFFQTDTAINPGNSGGPLINLRGEIVGINSSIYSGSGGWQGVGFAIPANVARHTMESLLKGGRVVRGYLGVAIQQVTPDLAQHFGLGEAKGALVTQVMPGSPAEKAGVKPGDIIRKFNGKEIKDVRELHSRVSELDLGTKAPLVIIRDKKEITLTAEIAEQTANPQAMVPTSPRNFSGGAPVRGVFDGIKVGNLQPGDAARMNLPENVSGVVVAEVGPNAPAAQWLQPGDVIEEINHQPISSVADFQKIADALNPQEKQILFICRGKVRSFVVISPK